MTRTLRVAIEEIPGRSLVERDSVAQEYLCQEILESVLVVLGLTKAASTEDGPGRVKLSTPNVFKQQSAREKSKS